MKTVVIYTDGSCLGNPGPGGYGAILSFKGNKKELSQGFKLTTNNRMELMAPAVALECLKQPCQVELYTDSQYVKNGINQWINKWKLNGWRTSGKSPVKNVDLWQKLDALIGTHEIDWQWVKGHSGHRENEIADQLANRGIDEL